MKYCWIFMLISIWSQAQIKESRDTILMGSRFKITIVDENVEKANQNIDKIIGEIVRIEELISDWKPSSQVSLVNQSAGIQAIKVDKEVFDLTKRALYFSEITDGAFDISFAAMERIYDYQEGWMEAFPSDSVRLKAIEKVGYRNVILDEVHQTIFLKKEGMKIGFGATGKGYAADKAKEFAQSLDIQAGIVDASGDMATWGLQPDGSYWKIGIHNPMKPSQPMDVLEVQNAAVTTSGSYEKFVLIGDTRYSHIINPKTGIPASGLISVSVIGPNAEFANGLSTSIMVLGQKEGLKLIQEFPEYACMMMSDEGKIKKSKGYHKVVRNLKK
jgi:thiamine biosynthesis lipoprotein